MPRYKTNSKLNILVLGSGGREHAIAWKLSRSKVEPKIFIAPGNAGTASIGENIDLDPLNFHAIKDFCIKENIRMVVVGPEEPLVRGIYDFFQDDPLLGNIIITGPSRMGAQLEGSKAFAKAFMKKYGIPTAAYREFNKDNFDDGITYIREHSLPIVMKADGLAAGKGVVICQSTDEAEAVFTSMIRDRKFGESGERVVIEAFLGGIELSVFVCTDGQHYFLLPEAKDYKKIGEGDKGPNTGGMGAISPVPFATKSFMETVTQKIIEPTIKGLRAENISYKGFIFFGLIKVDDEPYVIEYNCRLGDPETEVILLRLKNDLIEVLHAMHDGKLDTITSQFVNGVAMTVVAVSGGYPLSYKKGNVIEFNYLENPMEIKHIGDDGGAIVFHAGTREEDGKVLTNGGRVIAVSALTSALGESFELTKEIIDQIHFDGMYYRSDIGYEFLE